MAQKFRLLQLNAPKWMKTHLIGAFNRVPLPCRQPNTAALSLFGACAIATKRLPITGKRRILHWQAQARLTALQALLLQG